MAAIWERIQNEPVLITTLVGAILEFAIAFGVQIDETQKAAIMTLVAAVLAIFARQQVTPTGKSVGIVVTTNTTARDNVPNPLGGNAP